MIYTAKAPISSTIPQHPAFQQKGIPNLSQSKMGDLTIWAKPEVSQLAYDGYKSNIEAFIWATLQGKETTVNYMSFPCDKSWGYYSFPLKMPKLAFVLKNKKPTYDGIAKMAAALEPFGYETIKLSEQTTGYTLSNPSYKVFKDKILRVAAENMGTPQGYCSVSSFRWVGFIYRCIEGFMSTHTYPAFRSDDESYMQASKEPNYEISGKRRRDDSDRSPRKLLLTSKLPSSAVRAGTPDTDMHDVVTPESYSEVLKAKPSRHPSQASWGTPSSVPALPGLLFPYFKGMIAADVTFTKNMTAHLFYKLAQDGTHDLKASVKDFKENINTFCYTDEGLVIQHMLKAILMALDAQAHAYFLFDGGNYLGFCLLGAKFSVFDGTRWQAPLSPADLNAELSTLMTHDGAVAKLAEKFNALRGLSGELAYDEGDLEGPLDIAKALSKISITDGGDDEKEIAGLLEKLQFRQKYRQADLNALKWYLSFLSDAGGVLESAEPVYLNVAHRGLYADERFLALATFGPRAPSFYARSGVEYKIPKPDAKDPLSEVNPTTKELMMPYIIVGVKPVAEAHKDNLMMARHKKIKFEPSERAKHHRNITFRKGGRDILWTELKADIGSKVDEVLSTEPLHVSTGGPAVGGDTMEVSGDDELENVF